MNFTSLLNPYMYIGVAIVVAALGGTFFYQDRQIHHYHELFNSEHDNFTKEHQLVTQMTTKQNTQTNTTENNVTKVITIPGPIQTIVKEIHDAPEPANCGTPALNPAVRSSL